MSPRSWPVQLWAALGLLVAVENAGARAARSAAVGSDLPEPYIVAPFENTGHVKQLEWMVTAVAVTIAEKLEAHPGLRPMYGPAVLEGLDATFDPQKLARRAKDSGARWVIAGTFARPDWKSALTLRIYAVVDASDAISVPTLRLAAEASSVGERAQLLDQIDTLLLQVLAKNGWGPTEPEVVAQLRRRPTRDLYAFNLFGRALLLEHGLGLPRDLFGAIRLYKRIGLIDPKFAEAHRFWGLSWLEQGDRSRAASQFSYALDLKPGYYAALTALARLARADGNRTRAQELAEKALEARPWDVDSREMLGELYWELGELDEALGELEKVTAIQPRHLAARRTLALIYAAKGLTADLAAELERVQDLSPDDLDVKLDLGSAYVRMGKNERAISAYEEVLKRQPRNVQALKLVGDCYRRNQDPEKAILVYQKVRRLAPDDPRPYFLLGAAYEEAGDDVHAEAVFQDAQQFKKYLGEAWTNLGSIAFRKGDLSKADWYLSRAVARAPGRPKAHYNFALVLTAKKERDRALDELRIAGDLDPEDAEIRYLAGVILLRQGRLDEARQMFAEALKRRPDHPDAKHNLALLDDLERRYGAEHGAAAAQ